MGERAPGGAFLLLCPVIEAHLGGERQGEVQLPEAHVGKKRAAVASDGRRRRRSCDKNDSNIIGAKVAPPSEGTEHTAPGAVLLLHPPPEEGHGGNYSDQHRQALSLCQEPMRYI